jgi:predicted nucleotidyltransferase
MSFSVDAAAARINRDNQAYRDAMLQRRDRAQGEARRYVQKLLQEHPGIRRVWGFGSTFEDGRPFGPSSDVDLAIEGGEGGFPSGLFETTEFSIDVLDISGQDDPFTRNIRTHGVLLAVRE